MTDEPDILLKVFLAIDHLKLCVDHDNPTGEGVPLDIVVMPDLVVDVDGATITQLGNPSNNAPVGMLAAAEVGSRAGRVLSILAHLRDLDDEGIQLHYIAKTGIEGETILKHRLQQDLFEQNLQPLQFPLLMPRSQTRYAVLGRENFSDHSPRGRQILPLTEILTADELSRHFYSPLNVIENARSVFFATDTFSQFEALIDTAIFGRSEAGRQDKHAARHVFIDLSSVTNEPLRAFDEFKSRMANYHNDGRWAGSVGSRTALTVMVSANHCKVEPKECFAQLRLRGGTDVLMLYSGTSFVICDGNASQRSDYSWGLDKPGMRDAFVAGYLLFKAVASAWAAIPRPSRSDPDTSHQWEEKILPDPYPTSTEENQWPLDEAIKFASATARFWSNCFLMGTVPNRWVLLKMVTADPPPGQTGELLGDLPTAAEDRANWIRKFVGRAARLLAGEKDNAFLDGLRSFVGRNDVSIKPPTWKSETRALRLRDITPVILLVALRVLSLHSLRQRSRKSAAPDTEHWNAVNAETTAYLTDLDGTLVHSSSFRKLCLRRAFLSLDWNDQVGSVAAAQFPILPEAISTPEGNNPRITVNEFLDRCVALYNAVVYKQWEAWNAVLENYIYYAYGSKPKDFRQVWNHPLSYPVLLWRLREILLRKYSRIKVSGFSPIDILFKIASVPQADFDKILASIQNRVFKINPKRLRELEANKILSDKIVQRLKPLANRPFNTFDEFKQSLETSLTRGPSSQFSADEISNCLRIINRWSQANQSSDPVSVFLWSNVPQQNQFYLLNAPRVTDEVREIIVQALNRAVAGHCIHNDERFKGITLRYETSELLRKSSRPASDLEYLNRLLLEDAYPLELSKTRVALPPQLVPGFIWSSWVEEQQGSVSESTSDSIQDIDRFHRELADLESKHKRRFEVITTQFWDVVYAPYRQTKEMLRILREVYGFRMYVATEGHHDSQVLKLKTSGLQELFSESVTLSTGAAAEPHEELQIIEEETNKNLLWLDVLDQSEGGTFTRFDGVEITKESLNRVREYLEIYEQAWMKFQDKSHGGIYCLILASILVEPRSPLLALTNLRHLELMQGKAREAKIRVTMIGDREKKDILPLLDNWRPGKAPITTVRLLTLDHRKESLPWDEPTRAKFLAWSPLQALLLMVFEKGQPPPLTSAALPPLILLRLARSNGGIEDAVWNALVWGKDRARQKTDTAIAFSLIEYLVIQSTVRDLQTDLTQFVLSMIAKMKSSRNAATLDGYKLTFTVLGQLWRIVRVSETAPRKKIAEAIRDGICEEIRHGISRYDGTQEQPAVDLLDSIKTECGKPEQADDLSDHIVDQSLSFRLQDFLDDWPV